MYERVLGAVLKAAGSRRGCFAVMDESRRLICAPGVIDARDIFVRTQCSNVLTEDQWLEAWGDLFRDGKAVVLDGPLDLSGSLLNAQRGMAAPLVHQKAPVGLLLVADKPSDYTEDDRTLLETIGKKIAPILAARLERDTEERGRLATEAEREQLQSQLVQSQKIEAIGILAGGVAHDFNNILSSVQGHCELAMLKAGEGSRLEHDLKQVGNAAARGAALTRKLLLFSRKHPMEVSLLDINEVVTDMHEMLDRLIGEDITVENRLGDDIWTVRGDRTGIEQVIMNLAVNARDAMPAGGAIEISTENVEVDSTTSPPSPDGKRGKYVCLKVSDNGTGMDRKTVERIFEPFYTTKEMDSGTGLGLSVVHGIVKHHGGWIDVKSTRGQGSTFRVYLAATGRPAESRPKESGSLDAYKGSGERVLVVEDEDPVRELVIEVLETNGYKTTQAAGVKEALAIFEGAAGNFDLVVSDVVLGDGTGVDLIAEVLSQKPEVKCLLNSGYTDEKSQWPEIRDRGYNFLHKPFTVIALLRAVKAALASEEKTPSMTASVP